GWPEQGHLSFNSEEIPPNLPPSPSAQSFSLLLRYLRPHRLLMLIECMLLEKKILLISAQNSVQCFLYIYLFLICFLFFVFCFLFLIFNFLFFCFVQIHFVQDINNCSRVLSCFLISL